MRRCVAPAMVLLSLLGSFARAQRPDSTRCDSIMAAAAVDTADTGLYITIRRLDEGPEPDPRLVEGLAVKIAHAFHAPRPFRLSVFAGPLAMRGLRLAGADTTHAKRAASVTGTYSLWVTESGPTEPFVLRASFIAGLDSSMLRAIAAPAYEWRQLQRHAGVAGRYRIRLSDDSTGGSLLAYGSFPRMSVHDAMPQRAAPLVFPDSALADSLDHGETVLRFVVDRAGVPALETVEVVRSTSLVFARAAVVALADQRFDPATIRGCPVAQVVEFPFIFDAAPHAPRD